ncbi:hypothetical protein SK128_017115, partial [Halocaridina rubra]
MEMKEQQQQVEVNCKDSSVPCSHTPNLLELQLLNSPKSNGQAVWNKNPNIADVDVLQIEPASLTSSVEYSKCCGSNSLLVTSSVFKSSSSKNSSELRNGTGKQGL